MNRRGNRTGTVATRVRTAASCSGTTAVARSDADANRSISPATTPLACHTADTRGTAPASRPTRTRRTARTPPAGRTRRTRRTARSSRPAVGVRRTRIDRRSRAHSVADTGRSSELGRAADTGRSTELGRVADHRSSACHSSGTERARITDRPDIAGAR